MGATKRMITIADIVRRMLRPTRELSEQVTFPVNKLPQAAEYKPC